MDKFFIYAQNILSRLYQKWIQFGHAVAKVMNPMVLAFFFFLILTPVALIARLLGAKFLKLYLDRNAKTYWSERSPNLQSHMKDPF